MDDESGETGAWTPLLPRLFLSAPAICRFERSGKGGVQRGNALPLWSPPVDTGES